MSITRSGFAGPGRVHVGCGKIPWRMVAVASAVTAAGLVFATSVPTAGAVPPPPGAIVVGLPGSEPQCAAPNPDIQGEINAAADNATIYICAGTYTQQLTINKPLTLLGAQFGVDARAGRTNPAAETLFDVPAGAIVYTSGATTGTLDGFTLRNADGVAVNGIGNATAQAYTFQNNIITANTVGIDFHSSGPAVSLIARNRFVENNKNPGDPTSGSSIFLTSGTTIGLTIEDNLFQGNVGGNAADINTPGLEGALDTGITIRNNTSIDDATFAVINDTSGTQVLNNTIMHSDPAAASGTAILLFSTNPGVVISGNTINGGTGRGIGDFDPQSLPSGNPTITTNTISNRGVGIRLSQAGATVSGNTITNSTQFGIQMQATSSGGTITGNTMTSTTGIDCRDESIGSGTAGTANTWTTNIGITSSPAGLCLPPPPPTTTTTTTTIPVTTTTSPAPAATTTLPAILPPTPSPGSGTLPATGRNSTGPLVALGLILVAVGLTLTRVRRRA